MERMPTFDYDLFTIGAGSGAASTHTGSMSNWVSNPNLVMVVI